MSHVHPGDHFLLKFTELRKLGFCKGGYTFDGKIKPFDNVFGKFIANKRIEWDRYRAHVSRFEVEKYLPIL